MTEVIEGQRNFTVEEYHRMGEAGVFGPDERVELIWGVIREMSPKGRRHSVAVGLAMNLFVRRLEARGGVQRSSMAARTSRRKRRAALSCSSACSPRRLQALTSPMPPRASFSVTR